MTLTPEERTPPKSAKENAKAGLEIKRKWKRGGLTRQQSRREGLESGVVRANQLIKGRPLSNATIKSIAEFNQYREGYQPSKRDDDGGPTSGTIAWLLWGGTACVEWAMKAVERMNKSFKIKDNTDKIKGACKMDSEIKQLSFPFEIKEYEEEDLYFTFSGYAATFNNLDRGGDIIRPGAFTKTAAELMSKQKEGKLPILWQHKTDMPLGVFTTLKEDPHGLYVEGKMPKTDSFVTDRVIPQMKVGSIDSMSIGYSAVDYDLENDARYLNELKLFETSLITVPMNELALVTGMKQKAATPYQDLPLAPRDKPFAPASERNKRIRSLTDSVEEPGTDYKKAFFWYDAEEKDKFGAYKLPFTDVIDGKLMAIPRGVFAAAAALRGARGGVDLPSDERQAVINHVKRYYRKMDMDSPFDESSSFRIDDLESLNVREFEKLAREGIRLNSKNAKILASKMKEFLKREVRETPKDDVDVEPQVDTEFLSDFMDSIKKANNTIKTKNNKEN